MEFSELDKTDYRGRNDNKVMLDASRQLTTARWILVFVGLLSAGVNLFFFFQAEQQVAKEVDKELAAIGGRANLTPQKKQELKALEEQAVRITKIAGLIFSAVGATFLIFAFLIKTYPVPITITALILYIGANAVSALFDPETVIRGMIIKICIIVALAKSIQAALAFEDARKKEARRHLLDAEPLEADPEMPA